MARIGNGRPQQWSDQEIIAALRKTKGLIATASKNLGMSKSNMRLRIKASPLIDEEWRLQRALFVDKAESKLMQAVNEGNLKAVTYTLSRIGKNRGYVQRTETRIGGDANAPAIRHEQTLSHIPLELREKILEAMIALQSKKESQQVIEGKPLPQLEMQPKEEIMDDPEPEAEAEIQEVQEKEPRYLPGMEIVEEEDEEEEDVS